MLSVVVMLDTLDSPVKVVCQHHNYTDTCWVRNRCYKILLGTGSEEINVIQLYPECQSHEKGVIQIFYFCTECSPGTFGINCTGECDCSQGVCDVVDGVCSCNQGYTGSNCDSRKLVKWCT